MDSVFIQERIDVTKTMILAYETAMEALAGGAKSYTLNTGQTTQSVTKRDFQTMRETLDWLYSRLDYWLLRLNGGQTIVVRPI